MTVDQAVVFFRNFPGIMRKLTFLQDTGLGYLRLGQPATTLSGGEAQRLKISSYMATENGFPELFIFDEPTVGLHMDDIQKLLVCFQKLIEASHSLIVVEHNLDVIKSADYLITSSAHPMTPLNPVSRIFFLLAFFKGYYRRCKQPSP